MTVRSTTKRSFTHGVKSVCLSSKGTLCSVYASSSSSFKDFGKNTKFESLIHPSKTHEHRRSHARPFITSFKDFATQKTPSMRHRIILSVFNRHGPVFSLLLDAKPSLSLTKTLFFALNSHPKKTKQKTLFHPSGLFLNDQHIEKQERERERAFIHYDHSTP